MELVMNCQLIWLDGMNISIPVFAWVDVVKLWKASVKITGIGTRGSKLETSEFDPWVQTIEPRF
jgi:hypothetical protein